MSYEEFEKCITAPLTAIQKQLANAQSAKESNELFWKRITMSAVISRTIRHTLNHPDFAEKYLDGLSKATMDNNTPTPSKE